MIDQVSSLGTNEADDKVWAGQASTQHCHLQGGIRKV
jgi:hypothetical protein